MNKMRRIRWCKPPVRIGYSRLFQLVEVVTGGQDPLIRVLAWQNSNPPKKEIVSLKITDPQQRLQLLAPDKERKPRTEGLEAAIPLNLAPVRRLLPTPLRNLWEYSKATEYLDPRDPALPSLWAAYQTNLVRFYLSKWISPSILPTARYLFQQGYRVLLNKGELSPLGPDGLVSATCRSIDPKGGEHELCSWTNEQDLPFDLEGFCAHWVELKTFQEVHGDAATWDVIVWLDYLCRKTNWQPVIGNLGN